MKKGTKKSLSQAAVALNQKKAARVTPEGRARGGRKTSQKWATANADRDQRILALFDDGVSYQDIGRYVGVAPRNVRLILERHLGKIDGYARRGERMKGRYSEALRRASAERAAQLAQDAENLGAAYRSGVTVYALAEERGISVKQVRHRLRSLGEDVPDGRADPDRPIPPRPKKPPRFCDIPGCNGLHRSLGLCNKHYQRAKAAERKAAV